MLCQVELEGIWVTAPDAVTQIPCCSACAAQGTAGASAYLSFTLTEIHLNGHPPDQPPTSH